MNPIDLSAIKEEVDLEAEDITPYWANIVRRLVAEAEHVQYAEEALQAMRDENRRLRIALGAVVTFYDQDGACWCPDSKPSLADHMPACRQARAVMAPLRCRCGRPAYLGATDGDPRCLSCEYLPCETCDCAPDERSMRDGN